MGGGLRNQNPNYEGNREKRLINENENAQRRWAPLILSLWWMHCKKGREKKEKGNTTMPKTALGENEGKHIEKKTRVREGSTSLLIYNYYLFEPRTSRGILFSQDNVLGIKDRGGS